VYPFAFSIIEKVSIGSSKLYGAGNYNEMKKGFLKGVLIFLVLTLLFNLAFTQNTRSILIFLNIQPEIATISHHIFQYYYFSAMINFFGAIILYYLVSQGIEKAFIYFITVSLGLGISSCYYFDEHLNWGIMGWIYSTLIFEISMLIQLLVYFYICNKVGPFTRSDFANMFVGMKEFLKDLTIYYLAFFIQSIAGEISLYMCTQLKDNTVIESAAYINMLNICYLNYFIINGYSAIGRSKINRLIGSNDIKSARTIYNTITTGIILLTTVMGLIMYIFRRNITQLYTHAHPDVSASFQVLLSYYCIYFIYGYALYSYTFSVARMMKQTTLLIILEVVLMGITQYIVDYVIIHLLDHSTSLPIMISYLSIMTSIHIIILLRVHLMDWNTMKVTVVDESIHVHDA
jgi:Na+-driven multidrug efflux pump